MFLALNQYTNIAKLISDYAKTKPDHICFNFLDRKLAIEQRIDYLNLHNKATHFASYLQNNDLAEQRVILLLPTGLDYLIAFFGCLYAGSLAVSCSPLKSNNHINKLQSIQQDSSPALIIYDPKQTNENEIISLLDNHCPRPTLQTVANIESIEQSVCNLPEHQSHTVAYLQYSSGSTAQPKGIPISHGNILHNIEAITAAMPTSENSKMVSWLPLFHDMGLIGGLLTPILSGFPCYLLTAESFVMQPKRWLQAISRYKATSTVAPNFAYQLCIERIKDNIVDELDLDSIKFAWVGAEPVRRTTLINFSHKFAKTGFKTSAFYPCYGMAEATLFVSGGDYRELPRYALQNDNGSYTSYDITTPPKQTHCKEFVSCGKASLGQEIIIADSQSFIECEEGKTGEIFLTGQSIVKQYWENICSDTFVTLPGLGDTTYMATGDIGFIQNNELYITGRKKNMIIMAGRNIYAEDIEYCVEKACSAITKGGVAAFSVDNGHTEELIIVAELSPPLRRAQDQYNALQNEIFLHARTAIKHNIDIVLNQLILLRKGRLPRTSSGKIQHQQCKQLFLDNQWVNH